MRLAVLLLLIANAVLFAYAQLEHESGREPDRLADQLNPSVIRLFSPREAAALGVAVARSLPDTPDSSTSGHSTSGTSVSRASTVEASNAGATSGSAAAPSAGLPSATTSAKKPGASPSPDQHPAAPTPSSQASPAQADSPDGQASSSDRALRSADGGAQACLEWGPFSDVERTRAEADIGTLGFSATLTRRPVHLADAWWVNIGELTARAAADRRAGDLHAKAIDDLSVVDYGGSGFTVSLGVYRTEAAAAARARALALRGVTGLHVEPWKQPITLTMLELRAPS
ncbi:MAG: SPOR domain-containing protein, partial [Casimicrobiaceae bacterium]